MTVSSRLHVSLSAVLLTLVSCGPDLGTDVPLADDLETRRTGSRRSQGLVRSIVPAPVAPDGNVAGAVTDVVINLKGSMDPAVEGRSLLTGRTIAITLPDAFVNTGTLPLADVFSSPTCVPGNFECNTAILLQGWPQHPILPRFPPVPPGSGDPRYSLSMQGTHTLVFTADIDVVPGLPLPGPGIKQAHLLLFGFRNPGPGVYRIKVKAETGPEGAVETGSARLRIIPRPRPTISITSAFNEGAPNTIFQTTAPNTPTPFPYDFLLWARDAEPMTDVTIAQVNGRRWVLKQGKRVVGQVRLRAPRGATGNVLVAAAPSMAINAPVTGVPAARLTAAFTPGSDPGRYTLTFSVVGGNSLQTFVDVH